LAPFPSGARQAQPMHSASPVAGSRMCLRIDDIGASSKAFAVYSNRRFGNFLWLKTLPPFRAWGPYREMNVDEWDEVFRLLRQASANLTVAITGCWVEFDGTLVPFPEKFPLQAAKLKEGLAEGLLEIANHGLTHCVLQDFRFRPRLFSSNRKDHREFWDWLPEAEHLDHLKRSQEILQEYFGIAVTTLVPPGNVFSDATLRSARSLGITMVNCDNAQREFPGLRLVGNAEVLAFHDRELVLEGPGWLKAKLEALPPGTKFVFARDL
jgi:hypothetical protein